MQAPTIQQAEALLVGHILHPQSATGAFFESGLAQALGSTDEVASDLALGGLATEKETDR